MILMVPNLIICTSFDCHYIIVMIIHAHISWTMWHHYTNSVTFTYFLTNENVTTLQSLWWIDGIVAWISIHQVSSGFHYSSTPQIYRFFLFFAQFPSLSALSPVFLSSIFLSHVHFLHYIIKFSLNFIYILATRAHG